MGYRSVYGREMPDDLRSGRRQYRTNRREWRRDAKVTLTDKRWLEGPNVPMLSVIDGRTVMVVQVLDDMAVNLLQARHGRVHVRGRQHERGDRCRKCAEHDADADESSF